MDSNILQTLVALLRGGSKPSPEMLGSGGAYQAAQALQTRPYQIHVQEAKAMGEQPLTPEQFAQRMGQPQQ